MLGWSQSELAAAAGLSLPTVKRFETSSHKVSEEVVEAIRAALESAGVIFVEENGEGPGVRLRKSRGRADDHAKPVGPATDLIADEAIDADAKKRRRK